MKITNYTKLKPKKLIVFDLDGTLATTKSIMDQEMGDLLTQLMAVQRVAVIGGGKYGLFKRQVVSQLKTPKNLLKNFFLFPTTSTSFYRYDGGWKNVYYHELTKDQRSRTKKAFEQVFKEIGYQHPKKTYGKIIEDRGTQVTFSVFGQEIVAALGEKGVRMKEEWTKKNTPLKLKIAKMVGKLIPDLEVRAAGFTSIDVTAKGIDKAYGLKQIEKYLKVKIKDMVFIGDAIFPGGNDYAITKTPVDYIKVSGPEETKKVIRHLLKK